MRGRKRKACRRQPNGQPHRPKDEGTSELQGRRDWFGNGDPTLSTYPLGIMFANKAIGPEKHMAGLYYAWLHMIARPSRRIMTAAQRFERIPQGHEKNSEDSDYVGWLRRQKARYLEGRKAVEVILGIYKAAETGRVVQLPLKSDPLLKARKNKAK